MKKILKELTPPIFLKIFKNLNKVIRIKSRNDIRYKIGKYEINLPPEHTLLRFQNRHKLYDRFLPVLARSINKGDIIVDVGANVGDTAIMMLNETEAGIICVEPSDIFFKYLEKNVKGLPQEDRDKITCIKSLVGEQEASGELFHYGGTAKIEQNDFSNAKVERVRLDHLLKDERSISLIKVDTDGFDFDVIMSARNIIESDKPILFWENQINTKDQYNGYEKLYDFLSDMNYKHLYIFDNYGNIIVKNVNYDVLRNINDYIYSTDIYGGTKTFWYTDVLAVTEDKNELAKNVIKTYEREWVRVKKSGSHV